MSGYVTPNLAMRDTPDGVVADTIVLSNRDLGFALSQCNADRADIRFGQSRLSVPLTAQNKIGAATTIVGFTARQAFWMHIRRMVAAIRPSSFIDGIVHVCGWRAQPQMSEAKICNASDDVDTGVIVADTGGSVTCVAGTFARTQRAAYRVFKRATMRVIFPATLLSTNVSIFVRWAVGDPAIIEGGVTTRCDSIGLHREPPTLGVVPRAGHEPAPRSSYCIGLEAVA